LRDNKLATRIGRWLAEDRADQAEPPIVDRRTQWCDDVRLKISNWENSRANNAKSSETEAAIRTEIRNRVNDYRTIRDTLPTQKEKNDFLLEACNVAFDLSTNPIRLPNDETDRLPLTADGGAPFKNESEFQEHLTKYGLTLLQEVFLDPWPFETESANEPAGTGFPLTDFCKKIVFETDTNGVYFLAGGRGSGKSTILNQIAANANSRVEYASGSGQDGNREQRHLLVRLDLDTQFESAQFTVNLMSHICREVDQRVQTAPFTDLPWIFKNMRYTPGMTGTIGRWCGSNLRWLAVVLLIAFLLIPLANPQAVFEKKNPENIQIPETMQLPATIQVPATVEDSKTKQVIIGQTSAADLGLNAFAKFGYIVWVMIVIAVPPAIAWGALYRIGANSSKKRVLRYFLWYTWAHFVIAFGAAIHLMFVYFETSAPARFTKEQLHVVVSLFPNDFQLFLASLTTDPSRYWAVVWLVVAGVIALNIFALPKWWYVHSYCNSLRLAIQGRAANDGAQVPEIPYVTSLLRALLPQPSELPEINELGTPFAKQQLKMLLKRCSTIFDRIIILVDDVDVLRSELYHKLLRVLRPFTKVDNVRCCVSVPAYLYDGFHLAERNDLHSTVRYMLLVGDPYRYKKDEVDRTLEPRTFKVEDPKELLKETLEPILRSRSRLPQDHYEDQEGLNAIIDDVLDIWIDRQGSDVGVWGIFWNSSCTWRELIRETKLLLENPSRVPFRYGTRKAVDKSESVFTEGRASYVRSEHVLYQEGNEIPPAAAEKPKPPPRTGRRKKKS
jgi:hypothetical protein